VPGGRAPGRGLIVEGVKTVAREVGLQAPCSIERSRRAPSTKEPQERCGDAHVSCGGPSKGGSHTKAMSESLAWFRVEQTVERVRNPEGGKWWRIVHPAISRRYPIPSNAEGARNPRRGGLAFARAGPVVRQSSFEETDNSQRGSFRGQIREQCGREKTRRARPETVKAARGGPKTRQGSISSTEPLNGSRNLAEAKDRGTRTSIPLLRQLTPLEGQAASST